MLEYVIRPTNPEASLLFHESRLAGVFRAPEAGCVPIHGQGDYRLRCGDAEVAFGSEPFGWHVIFEGEVDAGDADRLVATFTRQIEDEVGEPAVFLRIT